MKYKQLLMVVSMVSAFVMQSSGQLITNFGASASNGGTWTYTAATSTLTGIEGLGDLIYGIPAFTDYSGTSYVEITADVTTAPLAGFAVILEDSAFVTATALFIWTDFIGGATKQAALIPNMGFNLSNVIGWSLVGGGAGTPISASLSSMSLVVPEPSTYLLLGFGGLALLALRRRGVGK